MVSSTSRRFGYQMPSRGRGKGKCDNSQLNELWREREYIGICRLGRLLTFTGETLEQSGDRKEIVKLINN